MMYQKEGVDTVAKFLDDVGLERVWEKVKAYVDENAGESGGGVPSAEVLTAVSGSFNPQIFLATGSADQTFTRTINFDKPVKGIVAYLGARVYNYNAGVSYASSSIPVTFAGGAISSSSASASDSSGRKTSIHIEAPNDETSIRISATYNRTGISTTAYGYMNVRYLAFLGS